jgi:DNA-binding transcriptional MocR family regulator
VGADRRRLLLGARVGRVRRQLGPTAWTVLEELLACSTGTISECSAEVSVRSLAGELGLSKDTVARALLRLRRAGLVTAIQSRSTTGVFAVGCYEINVPNSIAFDDDPIDTADTTTPTHAPKLSRVTRRNGSQLALSLDG